MITTLKGLKDKLAPWWKVTAFDYLGEDPKIYSDGTVIKIERSGYIVALTAEHEGEDVNYLCLTVWNDVKGKDGFYLIDDYYTPNNDWSFMEEAIEDLIKLTQYIDGGTKEDLRDEGAKV
jgi:hypothetical protein